MFPRTDLVTYSHVSTDHLCMLPVPCDTVCVASSDDSSRVVLEEIPDQEGSDYINACWMDVSLLSSLY